MALAMQDSLRSENVQVDTERGFVRARIVTPVTWSFEALHRQLEICGWQVMRITMRTYATLSHDCARVVGTGQELPLTGAVAQDVRGPALLLFQVTASHDWKTFTVAPRMMSFDQAALPHAGGNNDGGR